MREIGVRELKESLSSTLRAVSRGEQVRVTIHGRVVADIVPAGRLEDGRLRTLVAEGRLSPPSRSQPARPPRLVEGAASASDLILADRDAER